MKRCGLLIFFLAVILVLSMLTSHVALAADTNATMVSCEFSNAPASAAIAWLARLAGKPVIAPAYTYFQVSYRTEQKLARDQVIKALTAIFETNGLYLVNVNDSYYRLAREPAVGPVTDVPHVDVEVQSDQILVNGAAIDRKDLPQTLARLRTPETEVWVHHSIARQGPFAVNEAEDLLGSMTGLDASKTYLEYLPPTPEELKARRVPLAN